MARPTFSLGIDLLADPYSNYFDTVRASEPVSIWRMDDTSGSVLADYFAVNNGTRIASPTSVSGPYPYAASNALHFNGTSQYATVPLVTSQLAGSWELSGWAKPAAIGVRRILATAGSVQIELTAAGKIQGTVLNHVSGVGYSGVVTSSSVLVASGWCHVSLRHDATLDTLSLFINGILEASLSYTTGTEVWSMALLFAAGHSATAPSFGTVSAIATSSAGASLVITKPASLAAGDLMVAHIYIADNNLAGVTLSTLPSGWALLYLSEFGDNDAHAVVYKIADSGDVAASNFSFTADGPQPSLIVMNGVIMRFTGVDTSHPFANPPYHNTGSISGTTTIATGAKYPQCDDVLALALGAQHRTVSFSSSDGTEMYDTAGANSPGRAIAGYYSAVTTGSKSFTVTTNGTAGNSGAFILMLKGADGQNFFSGDLKDWSFRAYAPRDIDIQIGYNAKDAGEGTPTEFATRTLRFDSSMGRQYERDKIEAGGFSANLNNKDRALDPSNANSIYVPLKTLRRGKASLTVSGHSAVSIGEAYIEGFPSKWLRPNYEEMQIPFTDAFENLGQTGVTGSVAAGLSGTQINRVLDLAGWPLGKRNIDDGVYTMVAFICDAEDNDKALQILQDIAESEFGIFFIDQDGYATFHDRNHRFSDSRSTTIQATFEDVAGANIFYEDAEPSFDIARTFNDIIVSPDSSVLGATAQRVEDAQSIVDHRRRTDTKTTRLDTNTAALEIAHSILNITVEPSYRFQSLTVAPYDDASWVACLALKVSDRVRVIRNPQINSGGTTIDIECFIEGISWSLDTDGKWMVEYKLSPISVFQFNRMIIRSGPVAFYKLNSISSLQDSMQQNPGTITGTPTLVSGGLIHDAQQGLSLVNGSSSGTIPDSPALSLPVAAGGGMAIAMLLKLPSTPGSTQTLIGKTGSFTIEVLTSRKLRFTCINGGSSASVDSNTALSTGVWYLVGFVYNNGYNGTPQFGNSTHSTVLTLPPDYRGGATTGLNNLQVSKFSVLERGILNAINLWLVTYSGSPYPQDVAACAYFDLAGVPQALMSGRSEPRRIMNLTAQWYNFAVPPTPFSAGDLWLGGVGGAAFTGPSETVQLMIGAVATGGVRKAKNSVVAESGDASDTITGEPVDPFGTAALSDAVILAATGDYTPTGRTGQEGRINIFLNGQLDNFAAYTGGVADTANNIAIGGTAHMQALTFWNRIVSGVELSEYYAAR